MYPCKLNKHEDKNQKSYQNSIEQNRTEFLLLYGQKAELKKGWRF